MKEWCERTGLFRTGVTQACAGEYQTERTCFGRDFVRIWTGSSTVPGIIIILRSPSSASARSPTGCTFFATHHSPIILPQGAAQVTHHSPIILPQGAAQATHHSPIILPQGAAQATQHSRIILPHGAAQSQTPGIA